MVTSQASSEQRRSKGQPSRTPIAAALIDIHAVAEVLCVTPRHVQRLVAERRIPYLKVGRFVRFDPCELDVWLDEQRIEALRPFRCGTRSR
jgi:excisionase family DNA binding protein